MASSPNENEPEGIQQKLLKISDEQNDIDDILDRLASDRPLTSGQQNYIDAFQKKMGSISVEEYALSVAGEYIESMKEGLLTPEETQRKVKEILSCIPQKSIQSPE